MLKHFKRVHRLNELIPKTISERGMKLFEESGELAKAVNESTGMKSSSASNRLIKHNVLDEAADTIQCVFSVIHQFNKDNPNLDDITYEELVERVGIKNDVWKDKMNLDNSN